MLIINLEFFLFTIFFTQTGNGHLYTFSKWLYFHWYIFIIIISFILLIVVIYYMPVFCSQRAADSLGEEKKLIEDDKV